MEYREVDPRLKGGIWHLYWARGKKDSTLREILHEKERYYKIHLPFLQPRQITAWVYNDLQIPNFCGVVDRECLYKLYLKTRKPEVSTITRSKQNTKSCYKKKSIISKDNSASETLVKTPLRESNLKKQSIVPSPFAQRASEKTPATLLRPRKSVTFQEGVKVIDISPNPRKSFLSRAEGQASSTVKRSLIIDSKVEQSVNLSNNHRQGEKSSDLEITSFSGESLTQRTDSEVDNEELTVSSSKNIITEEKSTDENTSFSGDFSVIHYTKGLNSFTENNEAHLDVIHQKHSDISTKIMYQDYNTTNFLTEKSVETEEVSFSNNHDFMNSSSDIILSDENNEQKISFLGNFSLTESGSKPTKTINIDEGIDSKLSNSKIHGTRKSLRQMNKNRTPKKNDFKIKCTSDKSKTKEIYCDKVKVTLPKNLSKSVKNSSAEVSVTKKLELTPKEISIGEMEKLFVSNDQSCVNNFTHANNTLSHNISNFEETTSALYSQSTSCDNFIPSESQVKLISYYEVLDNSLNNNSKSEEHCKENSPTLDDLNTDMDNESLWSSLDLCDVSMSLNSSVNKKITEVMSLLPSITEQVKNNADKMLLITGEEVSEEIDTRSTAKTESPVPKPSSSSVSECVSAKSKSVVSDMHSPSLIISSSAFETPSIQSFTHTDISPCIPISTSVTLSKKHTMNHTYSPISEVVLPNPSSLTYRTPSPKLSSPDSRQSAVQLSPISKLFSQMPFYPQTQSTNINTKQKEVEKTEKQLFSYKVEHEAANLCDNNQYFRCSRIARSRDTDESSVYSDDIPVTINEGMVSSVDEGVLNNTNEENSSLLHKVTCLTLNESYNTNTIHVDKQTFDNCSLNVIQNIPQVDIFSRNNNNSEELLRATSSTLLKSIPYDDQGNVEFCNISGNEIMTVQDQGKNVVEALNGKAVEEEIIKDDMPKQNIDINHEPKEKLTSEYSDSIDEVSTAYETEKETGRLKINRYLEKPQILTKINNQKMDDFVMKDHNSLRKDLFGYNLFKRKRNKEVPEEFNSDDVKVFKTERTQFNESQVIDCSQFTEVNLKDINVNVQSNNSSFMSESDKDVNQLLREYDQDIIVKLKKNNIERSEEKLPKSGTDKDSEVTKKNNLFSENQKNRDALSQSEENSFDRDILDVSNPDLETRLKNENEEKIKIDKNLFLKDWLIPNEERNAEVNLSNSKVKKCSSSLSQINAKENQILLNLDHVQPHLIEKASSTTSKSIISQSFSEEMKNTQKGTKKISLNLTFPRTHKTSVIKNVEKQVSPNKDENTDFQQTSDNVNSSSSIIEKSDSPENVNKRFAIDVIPTIKIEPVHKNNQGKIVDAVSKKGTEKPSDVSPLQFLKKDSIITETDFNEFPRNFHIMMVSQEEKPFSNNLNRLETRILGCQEIEETNVHGKQGKPYDDTAIKMEPKSENESVIKKLLFECSSTQLTHSPCTLSTPEGMVHRKKNKNIRKKRAILLKNRPPVIYISSSEEENKGKEHDKLQKRFSSRLKFVKNKLSTDLKQVEQHINTEKSDLEDGRHNKSNINNNDISISPSILKDSTEMSNAKNINNFQSSHFGSIKLEGSINKTLNVIPVDNRLLSINDNLVLLEKQTDLNSDSEFLNNDHRLKSIKEKSSLVSGLFSSQESNLMSEEKISNEIETRNNMEKPLTIEKDIIISSDSVKSASDSERSLSATSPKESKTKSTSMKEALLYDKWYRSQRRYSGQLNEYEHVTENFSNLTSKKNESVTGKDTVSFPTENVRRGDSDKYCYEFKQSTNFIGDNTLHKNQRQSPIEISLFNNSIHDEKMIDDQPESFVVCELSKSNDLRSMDDKKLNKPHNRSHIIKKSINLLNNNGTNSFATTNNSNISQKRKLNDKNTVKSLKQKRNSGPLELIKNCNSDTKIFSNLSLKHNQTDMEISFLKTKVSEETIPEVHRKYTKSSTVRWKDMPGSDSNQILNSPEVETLLRRTFFMGSQ